MLGSRAFLVCSPNPRVGVTMTARLLVDWLTLSGHSVFGFDTDPLEAPLAARYPGSVGAADLKSIQGQMAVFDRLLDAEGAASVTDVWGRSFHEFFEVVRRTSFLAEAEARGVAPCLVYIADQSDQSRDVACGLADAWPDLDMMVVHNEGAAPFDADLDPAAAFAGFPTGRALLVPALDPYIRRMVEEPGFTFADFFAEPSSDMSLVVRAELRRWLMRVFDQFRAAELRAALAGSSFLR